MGGLQGMPLALALTLACTLRSCSGLSSSVGLYLNPKGEIFDVLSIQHGMPWAFFPSPILGIHLSHYCHNSVITISIIG